MSTLPTSLLIYRDTIAALDQNKESFNRGFNAAATHFQAKIEQLQSLVESQRKQIYNEGIALQKRDLVIATLTEQRNHAVFGQSCSDSTKKLWIERKDRELEAL